MVCVSVCVCVRAYGLWECRVRLPIRGLLLSGKGFLRGVTLRIFRTLQWFAPKVSRLRFGCWDLREDEEAIRGLRGASDTD